MNGAELIAAERQRQITEEGWTSGHDDTHVDGELANAAAYYAATCEPYSHIRGNHFWPLLPDGWSCKYHRRNPEHRIRMLAIAGALCAAEIDRLQRMTLSSGN